MNGKEMTLTFFKLFYGVYKKLGQLFYHTYLLACLMKDATVWLKVMNI